MRMMLSSNLTDLTLPEVILFDEHPNLAQLMGDQFRVEVMTDEILVMSLKREEALIEFASKCGIDPDGDLHASLYDEVVIVASYCPKEA